MTGIPEKTLKLIKLLGQQTAGGRRDWQRGSAETEFVFVHDAGSVIVSSVDGDGGPPYELRIIDTGGSIVERYESSGGDGMGILYEAAQKASLHSSHVTEDLLDQLSSDPSF